MVQQRIKVLAISILLLGVTMGLLSFYSIGIEFDGKLVFLTGIHQYISNSSSFIQKRVNVYMPPFKVNNIYLTENDLNATTNNPVSMLMMVNTTDNPVPVLRMVNSTDNPVPILRMVNPNNITVTSRKFAVVATTMLPGAYTYAFNLPLTVLSWKRISYETLVVIVGDEETIKKDRQSSVILDFTIKFGGHVKIIPCQKHDSIRLSQISRMFAANIFKDVVNEGDVLVTSDVDLWPIKNTAYDIPMGKAITSYNGMCCGFFNHKNKKYRMLPMSNIAANVSTWRHIFSSEAPYKPYTKEEIFDYTEAEFGDIVHKDLHKGGNPGWYLDQHLLSVKIFDWLDTQPSDILHYASRTGSSRIDRSDWKVVTLKGKIDVHLLLGAHQQNVWKRILPLLVLMFGENSEEYQSCLYYHEVFSKG